MTTKEFTLALEQIHLPEEKRRRMTASLASAKQPASRTFAYAAACTAVLLCGLAVLLAQRGSVLQPAASSSQNSAVLSTPSSAAAQHSLLFNKLEKQPSLSFQLIALMAEDFRSMSPAELGEYYGVPLPAELPGGLILQEITSPGGGPGIFQRENGEAYFDGNCFSYGNAGDKKYLTVTMAKDHLPYTDVNEAYDHPLTQSEINGIPVTAASYTNTDGQSLLYAEFLFQGNGYFLYADGISTDAFLQILLVLTGEG